MSGHSFTEEIRRGVAAPRPSGTSAPESTGSQRQATVGTSQGMVQGEQASGQRTYADRTARGPAQRGAPNSFGFRPQDQLEMQAYRETMAFRDIEAGGTARVDPDLCVNWWLTCAGAATLEILEPAPPEDLDPYAPPPSQAVLVTVFIQRANGAGLTFPGGVRWSTDVRAAAVGSDSPFGPAQGDAQVDAFTFMRVPDKGWFGIVTGRKFA